MDRGIFVIAMEYYHLGHVLPARGGGGDGCLHSPSISPSWYSLPRQ